MYVHVGVLLGRGWGGGGGRVHLCFFLLISSSESVDVDVIVHSVAHVSISGVFHAP